MHKQNDIISPMSKWVKNKNGFTIVELLIVIVIIGILAALVIAAYQGIQQRANNAKTVSAVQAYRKALIQYAIDHNNYPTGVWAEACLGEGYPDVGAFTTINGRNCFRAGGSEFNADIKEEPAFNNLLRPYLGKGKLPLPNTNIVAGVNSGTWSSRGAAYTNLAEDVTVDGVPNLWIIVYVLEGVGTRCPVGPVLDLNYYPSMTSANSPYGYSHELKTGVECWMLLPNPNNL